MEFLKGTKNDDVLLKVELLLQSFDDQLSRLQKEDTEHIRSRLLATQDLKIRANLLRKQIEINLPASADLFDRLLEESKDSIFDYLQYLSYRIKVAMSLETFTAARGLAEKGYQLSSQLYKSMSERYLNPDIPTQDVYSAYFRSCLDLFTTCRYQGHLEKAQIRFQAVHGVSSVSLQNTERNFPSFSKGIWKGGPQGSYYERGPQGSYYERGPQGSYYETDERLPSRPSSCSNFPTFPYSGSFLMDCVYLPVECVDLLINLYLDEAKAAAETKGENDDIILVQIFQADLLLAKGQLNEAINKILKPLLNTNLSEENRGLLLQKLGNGCRSAAQWGDAKKHLRNSFGIARLLEDKVSEYDRITDLGNVYRSEGRIADAVEQQLCHMAFAFSRGDLWGLTVACFNMGFAYYSVTPRPDLERALSLLAVKHDLASRTHNETLRGMALNNLGKVFSAMRQYEIAVDVLKQCVEVAKATGNLGGEGMAYGNLGTTYRALGQYDEAIIHHRKYEENASARGDDGGVAIMQRELALDYLLKQELEMAEKEVKDSILTSESIRAAVGKEDSSKLANFDKNQAEAYNFLQVILVRQGKEMEALALSEFARGRAITDIVRDSCAKKPGSANDTWIWKDDILIKSQLSNDLVDNIIAEFYRIADELDTNFMVYSIVTDYSEKRVPEKWLYVWLVKCENDLLPGKERITFRRLILHDMIAGNVTFDEKFFTSLSRSFANMNLMESGDVPRPQINKNPTINVSSVEENQEEENIELVFPDREDVREFMTLLESLSLRKRGKESGEKGNGAKGSSQQMMAERNVQVQELRERIKEESSNIEELNKDLLEAEENGELKDGAEIDIEMDRFALRSTWQREGSEQLSLLYRIYLAPLEDELPASNGHRVPRMTVIPHEFLYSVPFCAFRDSDGRYLVERYIITSTPSLRALHLLHDRLSQLRRLQGQRKLKVLAVGNPKMAYPDIPELPFSGTEAENVRDVFGAEQCQLAVKDKATKELVLNEIKNVDILHLATHAYPEDPEEEIAAQEGDYIMRGCLVLASSGEDCDGILKAHEIENATCACQLVLLSCCETGLGKLTGDGVVGLYRAFFTAGAAGVLVTLWKISDYTTPIFMDKFYSFFKDTEDVPLALRSAMLFCLKEKNLPPNQWAAFSLIGASKPRN